MPGTPVAGGGGPGPCCQAAAPERRGPANGPAPGPTTHTHLWRRTDRVNGAGFEYRVSRPTGTWDM